MANDNGYILLKSVISRLGKLDEMSLDDFEQLRRDARSVLEDPPKNFPMVNSDLALVRKFSKTLGIN